MRRIFCDGGVIGPNPSAIGGTWAYCWEDFYDWDYGMVAPIDVDVVKVTNNLTELLAAVKALESARNSREDVTVYTDSIVTMHRLKTGSRFTNIPNWLRLKTLELRRILKPRVVLIGGHPTEEELRIGKLVRNGYPTHELNVWCDEQCTRLANLYRKVILP